MPNDHNVLTWGDLSPNGKKTFGLLAALGMAGTFGGCLLIARYGPKDDPQAPARQAQMQQQLTTDALAGKSGSLVCSVATIPGAEKGGSYEPLSLTIPASEIAATNPNSTLRLFLRAMAAQHDCHGVSGP